MCVVGCARRQGQARATHVRETPSSLVVEARSCLPKRERSVGQDLPLGRVADAEADADGDGPVEAVTAPACWTISRTDSSSGAEGVGAAEGPAPGSVAATFAASPWGEAIGGVERSLRESENRFPSRLSRATRQDYRPRGN